MNVLRVLLLLGVLLVGLVIGAKNANDVELNFLFTSIHTTVGIAIIVSLLVGVIVGSGILLFFTLIPTYAKLRQTHKALAQAHVKQKNMPQSATDNPGGGKRQTQPIKKD